MDKTKEKRISKTLSYVLRHKPDSIGISLDKEGWTAIDSLLEKLEITRAELDYIVENNSKQRFSISGDLIRANQGHSVDIQLGLTAKIPPNKLFHGTAQKYRDQILEKGLLKMNRNHVHLSAELDTALQVGSRHGKPVVFLLDVNAMIQEGILFYQSENGVWLTEFVDPKFLSLFDS